MRFEKPNNEMGNIRIHVESGETEAQVLRVLLQASFALARPVDMQGLRRFDPTQMLNNDDADRFITRHGGDGFEVNDGGGRWLATRIHKVEPGVFELNTFIYERDRGEAGPFLKLAQDILAGRDSITSTLRDTRYMYQGEALTRILEQYRVKRKTKESDWDLRRRAFIEMDAEHIRRFEFFIGASIVEWKESTKTFVSFYQKEMTQEERQKFVDGMPLDPQILMGWRDSPQKKGLWAPFLQSKSNHHTLNYIWLIGIP